MGEDPYAGLLGEMDARAAKAYRPPVSIGTVLESGEGRLVIRADGMELDQDELYVAQYLTDGWSEQLRGLEWPVSSALPEKVFSGKCWVPYGTVVLEGTAAVTRPAETVPGATAESASATHPGQLQAGDHVLLLRSEDEQSYYVICRFVRWR